MAEKENSEPPHHQQSLYLGKAIEQVSREEQGSPAREVSPSSSSMAVSTLGSHFRLTCPNCLRDLVQPKQLKGCFHIFCRDCLQPFVDSAQGGFVTCPLEYCRRSCSKDDISKALRSDTYLLSHQGHIGVYMESGDLVCGNEDGYGACYFCFECGKNFCDTCQSDHSGEFRDHSVLTLFKTPDTQTVSINTSPGMALSVDEPDMASSPMYKCPICRNTDQCEHENWLKDLLDDSFRSSEICEIPGHEDGNRLIAYCLHPDCNKPICRNCSMIEHKQHDTMDISRVMEDKFSDLSSLKKGLTFHLDIFEEAAQRCKNAEEDFGRHIARVEQEMIVRKASMHKHVQEAFTVAFDLIERTGRKQVELNQQSEEMGQELQFLKTAIQLAEGVLEEGVEEGDETRAALEFVRVWKGLKIILEDLGLDEGSRKKHQEADIVLPQEVVEKKLVLPAPSCMNPDLQILRKVGVENKELRRAFELEADRELLLFYSILPLTQTEALVSCKPRDCNTSVVQYSNVEPHRHSVKVAEGGVYCTTAVPGEGIVATLYVPPGGCGEAQGKNQILFWERALGVSMTALEAQGAQKKTRVLKETRLPPWGLAVTAHNQLVVCTAEDHHSSAHEASQRRQSCILVVTLQGDVVRERSFNMPGAGRDTTVNFPRYVTVNVNGDICVTDERNGAVLIFNPQLRDKLRLLNPYPSDDMNTRFAPRGICHDSFGRLVIADPNNHAVLRMEYDDTRMTRCEVLLPNKGNKVEGLNSPMLVALGSGATEQSSRLWVVCRDNIQVFEYTDQE